MTYKTGPSPHRVRGGILIHQFKPLQPFYGYSRGQKILYKGPYCTDGVLNCGQAALSPPETCKCVLHEGRCGSPGHNKSSTEQLITAN